MPPGLVFSWPGMSLQAAGGFHRWLASQIYSAAHILNRMIVFNYTLYDPGAEVGGVKFRLSSLLVHVFVLVLVSS